MDSSCYKYIQRIKILTSQVWVYGTLHFKTLFQTMTILFCEKDLSEGGFLGRKILNCSFFLVSFFI